MLWFNSPLEGTSVKSKFILFALCNYANETIGHNFLSVGNNFRNNRFCSKFEGEVQTKISSVSKVNWMEVRESSLYCIEFLGLCFDVKLGAWFLSIIWLLGSLEEKLWVTGADNAYLLEWWLWWSFTGFF